MNVKNCRALNSTLAALLILQMGVLVPLAHATDPYEITKEQSNFHESNKSAKGDKLPVNGKMEAQAPKAEAPKAVAGSDETRAYCYNHKTEQSDATMAKRWQDLLGMRQTTHKKIAVISPDVMANQNNFKNAMVEVTTNKVNGVCALRREVDGQVKLVETNMQAASLSGGDGEACTREHDLYNNIQLAATYHHNYANAVKFLRLGRKAEKGATASKGVISIFSEQAKGNWQAIQNANTKKASFPANLPQTLEQEFSMVWGENAHKKSEADLSKVMGSRAIFADLLDSFYYEQKNAERLQETLKGYSQSLSGKFKACNLGDPLTGNAAESNPQDPAGKLTRPARQPGKPVLDPQEDEDSTVSARKTVKPGDGTTEDSLEARIARNQKVPAYETSKQKNERITELNADLKEQKRLADLNARTEQENDKLMGKIVDPSPSTIEPRPPRVRPSEDPPEPIKPLVPTVPREENTASSFLSNNAGLLVGGALVVGGGVGLYYWDKSEKKKKQDEWEAYWASVNKGTSTSTSTSTSTDGSRRLTIRSNIANAVVGVNLPGIQVAITDLNGTTLTNQDTDITVSCVNPIPCTLTGTTTVRSVSGVATFSDLKFTGAHVGVRLRYSTTFGNLEQSNGFDVTATAPNRQ